MHRRPTLVAIGRLSAEKGYADLVTAFAQVNAARGHTHQLLIVGEGPERATLSGLIGALGAADTVMLAGYLEGPDRLLGAAAGFVMNSFTEGMPLVLLEAMQWRVPILASAVGAIPELLGSYVPGTVVAARAPQALAQALEGLLDRPPGPPGQAGTGLPAHFASRRMAQDYLRLYAAIT
jgi:glycosyltransferase involved in cell wall biosynthesis